MKEIDVTDQRPKTTKAEMPEGMRALKPMPKDPVFEREKASFLSKLRERMDRRMAERRRG